jgi:hypothetical protein
MKSSTPDLANRRGLRAALIADLPATTSIPTGKKFLPVDDNISPENLETNQETITTSPTLIVAARAGRCSVLIMNLSATNEIWYGKNNRVSSTNGGLLPVGRGQWVAFNTQSAIWGVVAAGSASVCFTEVF